MDENRKKFYSELETRIGRTSLVEYSREIPNGNVILIKRECDKAERY